MIVQLTQLVMSAGALRELAQLPLPAAASFRLDDILRSIEPELASYDATLEKLAARYDGKKREHANLYDFPAKHRKIVQREVEQLLETNITIPYDPLQRSDIDGATIKPVNIRALAWLFGSPNGNPAATSSSESPSKLSSSKAPAGNGRNAATRGTRDVDSRIEQLEK